MEEFLSLQSNIRAPLRIPDIISIFFFKDNSSPTDASHNSRISNNKSCPADPDNFERAKDDLARAQDLMATTIDILVENGGSLDLIANNAEYLSSNVVAFHTPCLPSTFDDRNNSEVNIINGRAWWQNFKVRK